MKNRPFRRGCLEPLFAWPDGRLGSQADGRKSRFQLFVKIRLNHQAAFGLASAEIDNNFTLYIKENIDMTFKCTYNLVYENRL